ncbi:hypothetical protein GRI43_06875 [Altererythrobacter luteolus]|uniref:PRC-barrel domain-containing protein n=1 Tax=Pontixanthobacter luteolus TaxID=295089 RepID=A0A6I4V1G3_9SPHN|nr:hypothetical protein [Pontixanthobacter luteolus]MXP47111.1 hypothetical protein [Pontixanthobacter luteolus]
MKFMKLATLSAIAAASLSTSAFAAPAVGDTITGPEGGTVGTVEAVADGMVTFNTGKHNVTLPTESFGEGDTGPTITVTKTYLDDAMDAEIVKAAAARDALLVEGAAVLSANQQPLGVVESVDGDTVVVAHADGPVSLLREHFVAREANLMALFTNEQIKTTIAANSAS